MVSTQVQLVSRTPTVKAKDGLYCVIDNKGIYWGTFRVSTTWTGEKAVQEAWGNDLVESHNFIRTRKLLSE